MKKLILFFCATLSYSVYPHSLALVHLGDELPSYIGDSMKQARIFNPLCDIYLIASKAALAPAQSIIEAHQIKPIPIETLTKTDRHTAFLQKTGLKPGLWRYACERFLYLDDFMRQNKITDLFHIENDVMLYADLAELMPIIKQNYQGIAAVFDNDDRCIPSFMFIPDARRMLGLTYCFVLQASKSKFDMHLIAFFRDQAGPAVIDRLPIIMDSYINTYQLKNKLGQIPANPHAYANNINHFNSIFDAAALGQYLGGTFFAEYGPGFINETCVFDPSKLKYEWLQDGLGRKIPYAVFQDKKYRINNLHIHSKKLKEFASA